jgi:hypothetical protein
MREIQLSEFAESDKRMPWVYESLIGDPIEYGDQGKGAVRWATGQQVRVMHPARCTRCWNAARGGDSPAEFIGLVSVLHSRSEAGRGPTEWVTYCPPHFASAFEQGRVEQI